MSSTNSSSNSTGGFLGVLNGNAGEAGQHITIKAFGLNVAFAFTLFLLQFSGFQLLKSLEIGRRLYQPKGYLVQERLRVEAIPVNPFHWIHRIFTIKGEELKAKCGLDGYFFIRLIRAMIVIFLPLMAILVTVLLPVNYHGGKDNHVFLVLGHPTAFNVTGLDRLSWQNVAPTQTQRYWAHLICALLAISWTLYRIYREKMHFIKVRQDFLTAPEHRLKASARTVLITNIPSEYRSGEALKALYDIFVDNDDRAKLFVWVNRDYKYLRSLVRRRKNLCSALEKEELRLLRMVNKKRNDDKMPDSSGKTSEEVDRQQSPAWNELDIESKHAYGLVAEAFEADCRETDEPWHAFLDEKAAKTITIAEDGVGHSKPVSLLARLWTRGNKRKVPKIAWMRSEIARLTIQIDELLPKLDNEEEFPRQNSAFVQFDRQMAANMACCLVSHHLPGDMTPRFLDVAPHEILWPNMGITSVGRFIRSCIALLFFVAMLVLWGIPTTILGSLSQLETLRATTWWLAWLRPWPSYIISFIAGPLSAILLALLVQLLVPALCRKLAVLIGAPTRSTREVTTQKFYFTFLLVELVLVTSISSGLIATIPQIVENPISIPMRLATDLPKAANYFFNYLIIQALGFSGSVLFQYLRILYITLIWPWFTQTPRQEAWLQTTIPHQMWGNVYPLFTNFAVIGLIYSVTAPLMLIFSSATFILFWIAYRHNYYYVQRNKVDTHGMLFCNALSQLFAGVYILEVTLIGLFFLVQDDQKHFVCVPQGIIMIVLVVLTAAFHYVMESTLRPLYDLLPVTLDDEAVEKERKWLRMQSNGAQTDGKASGARQDDESSVRFSFDPEKEPKNPADAVEENPNSLVEDRTKQSSDGRRALSKEKGSRGLMRGLSSRQKDVTATAANARQQLSRLKKEAAARLAVNQALMAGSAGVSQRRQAEDQLGAAIAGFPDELTDLTSQERDAELKAAYQDPVTRELAPVVWLPQDAKGVSEETIKRTKKYGRFLQYSNTGAVLTPNNKCVITEPAPDVRGDWLLDWVL